MRVGSEGRHRKQYVKRTLGENEKYGVEGKLQRF